jgi:hypothetical protein
MDLGGWKLAEHSLTEALQIAALRVFNYVEFFLELLGHDVAQPFFLFLTKHIGIVDDVRE